MRRSWMDDVCGVEVESPADEVVAILKRGKNGPLASIDNLVVVLSLDPRLRDHARFDEFRRRVTWQGEPFDDEIETAVNVQIARRYGIHTASAHVGEAIRHVARKSPFHPVRDYLRGLLWDQTPRLETWMINHLGVEDTTYARAVSRCFPISAVARVMSPGCKVDTVPVLHGAQGLGKSTAFRVLAGDAWFSDSNIDFGSKDAYQSLPGVWIYELSELESLRRSEGTAIKAFLSAQHDHYRPSYGRNTVDVPRQNVFVGTTNELEFLRDPTGSRRFWPLTVTKVDVAGLVTVRDQLWAEAVHRYDAGERWWLDEEVESARAARAEHHQGADPWIDPIAAWASERTQPFTIAELLERAINKDPAHQERRDAMRAGEVLAGLGYVKQRSRAYGDRTPRWWRT